MPNISTLSALEELAGDGDKDGYDSPNESPHGSVSPPSLSRSSSSSLRSSPVMTAPQQRAQQLAAAAEESIQQLATAAVAAVAAKTAGRDTSGAAAAAQAAAAQAVSLAANANAAGFAVNTSEAITGLSDTSAAFFASSLGSERSSRLPPLSISIPPPVRSAPPSPALLMHHANSTLTSTSPPGTNKLLVARSITAPLSPSPSLMGGNAGSGGGGSELEGIDIAGLISQLSLKKDEGMVDDKLIRDLQIIQSLIGALKGPSPTANGLHLGGMTPSGKSLPKRSFTYSPGMNALHSAMSMPH